MMLRSVFFSNQLNENYIYVHSHFGMMCCYSDARTTAAESFAVQRNLFKGLALFSPPAVEILISDIIKRLAWTCQMK